MKILLLVLFALTAVAAVAADRDVKLYRWSLATVVAASAADAVTSYNRPELNPVFGQRFTGRDVALKAGIVGAGLLVQWAVTRRRPEWRKRFAAVNFASAGITGGVAARNWRMR